MARIIKLIVSLCITLFISLLAGCIRQPGPDAAIDPYEPMNRAFFAFNNGIDKVVIRPATKVYTTITPPPLQHGLHNVLGNITMLTTIPNDLLQFKLKFALVDFWRLFINTTIGIGGLFDVATKLGFPKHYEDFGMTLATWTGKDTSPYLVLPLMGPHTFRDGFGRIFDYGLSPWPYVKPDWVGWVGLGAKLVDIRRQLLPTDKFIQQAFDPYIFVRDAYLQTRKREIEQNRLPYMSHLQRMQAQGLVPMAPTENTNAIKVPGNVETNATPQQIKEFKQEHLGKKLNS